MAWTDHCGPLRASLRAVYGIDLSHPGVSLSDLADLVADLPPGCALWRSVGGPLAWSAETHALMAIEHGVRVLAWQQTEKGTKGRDQPRPVEHPPLAGQEQTVQATTDRRAARYLARTKERTAGG